MSSFNLAKPKHPDWAHSYEEYKQLLKLPLANKIERAHMIIIDALQHSHHNAVACSWGKDSIVLVHLVRDFCPNIKIVYHNTGVEYPQNLAYRDRMLKEWNITNYEETKPLMSFWECAKIYGMPQTRKQSFQRKKGDKDTPMCCKMLKEKPAKIWRKENKIELEFVGLQAAESMSRRLSFLREGESFFSKTYKLQIVRPLMIWTDKDIWEYHKLFNIPKNPLYDIMPRNGCMPCTGFQNWEKVMAKANPKLYQFVSKKMGALAMDCWFGKVVYAK